MLKTLSCDHQGLFNDISHDFLASLNMDWYPLNYLVIVFVFLGKCDLLKISMPNNPAADFLKISMPHRVAAVVDIP